MKHAVLSAPLFLILLTGCPLPEQFINTALVAFDFDGEAQSDPSEDTDLWDIMLEPWYDADGGPAPAISANADWSQDPPTGAGVMHLSESSVNDVGSVSTDRADYDPELPDIAQGDVIGIFTSEGATAALEITELTITENGDGSYDSQMTFTYKTF